MNEPRLRAEDAASVSIYGQLPYFRRLVVQSWLHRNGGDWTDALLSARALDGMGPARHPRQARDLNTSHDSLVAYTEMLTPRSAQTGSARHEAAHAVVAAAVGARVVDVEIDKDGRGVGGDRRFAGLCQYNANGVGVVEHAAICLAAEVYETQIAPDAWLRLASVGCGSDRAAAFELTGDDVKLNQAAALAHRILGAHQGEVLALADVLERDGKVTLSTRGDLL